MSLEKIEVTYTGHEKRIVNAPGFQGEVTNGETILVNKSAENDFKNMNCWTVGKKKKSIKEDKAGIAPDTK